MGILRYILSIGLILVQTTTLAARYTYAKPKTRTNVSKYIPKNFKSAPTYGKKLESKYKYCPPVYRLKKVGMRWNGANGWRSNADSFVDKIAGFQEAQWNGVTVGKILCVYKGVGAMTFPVTLQRANLVLKPKGDRWSEAGERFNRFMRCKALNPGYCGFLEKKAGTSNMKDIYSDIASFK